MTPSSRKKTTSAPALKAIDLRLSRAGVARSPRPTKSRPTRNVRPTLRFERATPEELTAPPPVPRLAANGVQWLPIPGWDLPWLWAGFSTRKGGLSRAYCPESSDNAAAAGELNLGFTAADNRETVQRNRRLLAEAITSNAATPLIAL